MFDGFGDTGVMVLVNPCKVRSVPNHESNKMRVSEMFILGIMNLSDYESHLDEDDLISYSNEYNVMSIEELEKELANKSYEGLSCQDNVPVLTINNIVEIKNALKARIVKI